MPVRDRRIAPGRDTRPILLQPTLWRTSDPRLEGGAGSRSTFDLIRIAINDMGLSPESPLVRTPVAAPALLATVAAHRGAIKCRRAASQQYRAAQPLHPSDGAKIRWQGATVHHSPVRRSMSAGPSRSTNGRSTRGR